MHFAVRSIKAKLMGVVGLLVLGMMGCFVGVSGWQARERFHDERVRHLQGRHDLVVSTIADRSRTAYALAAWVARQPDIQGLLADRNRDGLLAATLAVYEFVKEEINLDQFQFHLPPAVSFLRLHQPDKFGDDLRAIRPTVVYTNGKRKPAIGLDRGRFGLGIRGVVPVFHREAHIGSLEFGMAVNDQLLAAIKEHADFDSAIVLPVEDGFQVIAGTRQMPAELLPVAALRQALEQKGTTVVRSASAGGVFLLHIAPLKDFAGNTVAALLLPDDITAGLAALRRSQLMTLVAGLLLTAGIMVLGYLFLHRFVSRPIAAIERTAAEVIETFALGRRVPVRDSGDEIAAIGRSFNVLLEHFQAVVQKIAERVGTLKHSSAGLSEVAGALDGAADVTSRQAATVAAGAEEMNTNMASVTAAMEQTTTNVTGVGAAAEEMTATVAEIAQNAEHARSVTAGAVSNARGASQQVEELGDAARAIGAVVETINGISEQVNLLALNATIEAARAGEAGKGFAVVAGEIKDLARQTAAATDEIKTRIEGIQGRIMGTVSSIGDISGVVESIDEIVATIAAAVEEQAVSTREIADNVNQAAGGIAEVNENVAQSSSAAGEIAVQIARVNETAGEMKNGSRQLQQRAAELAAVAGELDGMVGKFSV